ncbi:MAG TPA: radical SAM protein [Thermoanaerobaculia bacterium]
MTLIHHPTVALRISGFTDPDFEELETTGGYLGNVYRKIIPPSLPRVASILERDAAAEVDILDLRVMDSDHDEIYRTIDWEGYRIDVERVGAPFSAADEAIDGSEWIGLSSHFTYESGVIRDLIAYAKRRKPSIKVMVGGADVKARAQDYLTMGADLAFVGDFDPEGFLNSQSSSSRPMAISGRNVVGPYSHPFPELIDPSFSKLRELNNYSDSHDGPVPAGVSSPIGFIYFTRGCPRECDFCESRQTKFEALDLDASLAMLENYQRAGIQTVNFADDNLLLLAARKGGREDLLNLFAAMRKMRFAWEFPNGLEIGRLLGKENELDEDVMEALFSHTIDAETGRLVGAYRVYIPVETFDRRGNYKKLKSVQDQNRILSRIASAGLPEMNFGVVIPPNATEETFEHTRDGYQDLRELVTASGDSKARYAVFHLIPISLFRSMPTKYSVWDFPEGWNFYFPVYDGNNFTARELFERRLRLVKEIDYENFVSMTRGQYGYS